MNNERSINVLAGNQIMLRKSVQPSQSLGVKWEQGISTGQ
jgi:hypothetical protein